MERLAAGDRLDHYTIMRCLGSGAVSTAYAAIDTRGGAPVVLKCASPAILGNATAFQRFRREMEIARRLHHPNIQQGVDRGETRSMPYLVLEYLDGEDLRHVLTRRDRLAPACAVSYARDLLSALEYAHGQHVVHRDLKPENVLLTVDGTLKLIDFGSAYLQGSHRLTWSWNGPTIGTPSYMAPEQIRGKRGDGRADLYALGAMLYEMLTGTPPFEGETIFATMEQHLRNTPTPPSQLNPLLPSGLESIILKALRKNPAERYQTAGEMLSDLNCFETLCSQDFDLPDEAPVEDGHPNRLLSLVAGGIALSFVGSASLILAAAHVLIHHAPR